MTALADLVSSVRGSSAHDEQTSVRRGAPRVNLLPPEVLTRRATRRAQRAGVMALGAVLVAITAGWALGSARTAAEQDSLDAARARVSALQAQQAEYAAAPQTIARLEAVETARSAAMARDVAWSDYTDSLAQALPTGAWLVSVQAGLSGGTAGAAAVSAGTGAASSLGSVSISASATSYEDVAAYLDALAAVPGVTDPYLTGSTQDSSLGTPVVSFTVTAQMTDDALTRAYDPSTEQKAG